MHVSRINKPNCMETEKVGGNEKRMKKTPILHMNSV